METQRIGHKIAVLLLYFIIFDCKYKSVHYLRKSLHNINETSSLGIITTIYCTYHSVSPQVIF